MPSAQRTCFDRVPPRELFRFQEAVRVRRGGRFRAIAPVGKLWMNGSTLRVKFLGGTAAEKATAKVQANWWSAHANLKFEFGNAPDAEIRISFDGNDGAWSYIGTDARGIAANQATMNLGFLDGGTAGHEFGHAIGLAHEHQNPAGGIQWNEAAVIAALAGSPNFWDEATTRHNVLEKYRLDQVNGTEFDPDSIMLYFFPVAWTTNGVETKQNEVLSDTDKMFVAGAKMYPKTQPGVTGTIPELTVNASKRKQESIGKAGEEDLFRFRVETGARHVIDTKGSTDIVMKLFGPNSPTRVIAEDDDSGIGTNARIVEDLIPGEYFLQVRHWNREKGTGKYSIAVRRP